MITKTKLRPADQDGENSAVPPEFSAEALHSTSITGTDRRVLLGTAPFFPMLTSYLHKILLKGSHQPPSLLKLPLTTPLGHSIKIYL